MVTTNVWNEKCRWPSNVYGYFQTNAAAHYQKKNEDSMLELASTVLTVCASPELIDGDKEKEVPSGQPHPEVDTGLQQEAEALFHEVIEEARAAEKAK